MEKIRKSKYKKKIKREEVEEKNNLEIMSNKEEENKDKSNEIYNNSDYGFFIFNYYKYLLKFYNKIINFHHCPFYFAAPLLGYSLLFSSLL